MINLGVFMLKLIKFTIAHYALDHCYYFSILRPSEEKYNTLHCTFKYFYIKLYVKERRKKSSFFTNRQAH